MAAELWFIGSLDIAGGLGWWFLWCFLVGFAGRCCWFVIMVGLVWVGGCACFRGVINVVCVFLGVVWFLVGGSLVVVVCC